MFLSSTLDVPAIRPEWMLPLVDRNLGWTDRRVRRSQGKSKYLGATSTMEEFIPLMLGELSPHSLPLRQISPAHMSPARWKHTVNLNLSVPPLPLTAICLINYDKSVLRYWNAIYVFLPNKAAAWSFFALLFIFPVTWPDIIKYIGIAGGTGNHNIPVFSSLSSFSICQ